MKGVLGGMAMGLMLMLSLLIGLACAKVVTYSPAPCQCKHAACECSEKATELKPVLPMVSPNK